MAGSSPADRLTDTTSLIAPEKVPRTHASTTVAASTDNLAVPEHTYVWRPPRAFVSTEHFRKIF